jgi:hypothetical protein
MVSKLFMNARIYVVVLLCNIDTSLYNAYQNKYIGKLTFNLRVFYISFTN